MPSFGSSLPDMVIALGATASDSFTSDHVYGDAIGIGIASPAGLAETGKIQASYDPVTTADADATWFDVEAANDQSLLSTPAAGQTRVYYELPVLPRFRIAVTVAAAAERTFKLYKLWDSER